MEMSPCIPWWGAVHPDGYGVFRKTERLGRQAHRRVYEECFGPIPAGMLVHHRCARRNCVNPEHLELTTPSEHPDAAPALQRAKTHCPLGHEFTAANTIIDTSSGGRRCRICRRAWFKSYKAKRRAAAV